MRLFKAPRLDKPKPHRLSRRVQPIRSFPPPRQSLGQILGWLMLVLVSAFSALAQPAASPTVAGTWTYTLDVSLDTSVDFTAELKQDGEKVTGTVKVQEVVTVIEKGRFKDGQLTFEIPREYGGVKFTSRYQGKVTGDLIKGKIASGIAPAERTYEWHAKRAKPAAKP